MTEHLPDDIMLDEFEQLLDAGEYGPGRDDPAESMRMLLTLATFVDENGRRLLLLARVCHQAATRQGIEP